MNDDQNDKSAVAQTLEVKLSSANKFYSIPALAVESGLEDQSLKLVILFLIVLCFVFFFGMNPFNRYIPPVIIALFLSFIIWALEAGFRKAVSYFMTRYSYSEGFISFETISANDLRERWGRTDKNDFLNALLETRLNVYLKSKFCSALDGIIKYFYSAFFPQKERVNLIFSDLCFFDLNEVEEVEQKYPRFLSREDHTLKELNLKIKELEKDKNSFKTRNAREAKDKEDLLKAQRGGLFLANMMLEMVKDPTPLKQFTHKDYIAIHEKVKNKKYIQNLKLNHPTKKSIDDLRLHLPPEFRHPGNFSQ